jgi:hypothetical protein
MEEALDRPEEQRWTLKGDGGTKDKEGERRVSVIELYSVLYLGVKQILARLGEFLTGRTTRANGMTKRTTCNFY